jgi:hypothetical protein
LAFEIAEVDIGSQIEEAIGESKQSYRPSDCHAIAKAKRCAR